MINALDIVLLLAFIPAVIRGIKKGFIEQFLALAGTVVGIWAAYHFSAHVSEWIKPHIDASDTLLGVISFIIILIAVGIGVFFLSRFLGKLISTSLIGWADKLLGVISGCLITAMLLATLIISVDTLNTSLELMTDSETLANSKLYNFLKDAGYVVFPYLKQLLLKQ